MSCLRGVSLALALVLVLALLGSSSASPRRPFAWRPWGFSFSGRPSTPVAERRFPNAFVFGAPSTTTEKPAAANRTTPKPVTESSKPEPETSSVKPEAAEPTSAPPTAAAPEPESAAPGPEATPAAKPNADSIFFPGQDELGPKDGDGDSFVPECDGVPYMARNKTTERCQFLMLRGDCAEGEWFVLDRESREAACRPKPCPSGQVLHNGECRPRNASAICPAGMEVLVNEYGEAACDCAVRHVYWPQKDRCYPAFRQGPCHVGKFVKLVGDAVRCSDNICVRDGAAFWNTTRRCYRLRDTADSPCDFGRLDVGEESLELECVSTQPNAVFDLPVVRCSPGSKLDYKGRCKRELYQRFRSSFTQMTVDNTRQRRCEKGFIRAPSGRCLKASTKKSLG